MSCVCTQVHDKCIQRIHSYAQMTDYTSYMYISNYNVHSYLWQHSFILQKVLDGIKNGNIDHGVPGLFDTAILEKFAGLWTGTQQFLNRFLHGKKIDRQTDIDIRWYHFIHWIWDIQQIWSGPWWMSSGGKLFPTPWIHLCTVFHHQKHLTQK